MYHAGHNTVGLQADVRACRPVTLWRYSLTVLRRSLLHLLL